MKFTDFLKLEESKQDIESALKDLRVFIRKPNSGVAGYGAKDAEKIIDTLLASVDDKATFERYYDKFMAEMPDAMDFILEELYAKLGVKTAEEFFAKIYP